MASQHCRIITNNCGTEEAEKRSIYLQNRLLSMICPDNLSDVELAYTLLGLFFTEYAPPHIGRDTVITITQ